MNSADEPLPGRRWHAPREDRAILVDPPPSLTSALIEENRHRRSRTGVGDASIPWALIAAAARRELLAAAHAADAEYVDPAPQPIDGPLIVAGHQPGLFHPGVWFKNFLIAALARTAGGAAVNLVIDSDTCKAASLPVPTGTVAAPQMASVPFDAAADETPYEERAVLEPRTLESFGARAAATLQPLVAEPLLREFWPLAVRRARATGNLGRALAESRHQWERSWGLSTWEVRWSQVLDLPSVRRLTALLLSDADRLRQHYNRSIGDYRRIFRVRSRNHPAPLLARDDDWCEVPFRVWTRDSPRRRRLFVKLDAEWVHLTDRAAWSARLPRPRSADDLRAAEALQQLAASGVRLRTRALATTLYARMLLADLFVHGIGGGMYDQVADLWMHRAWNVAPPRFVVATATLFLPVRGAASLADDTDAAGAVLRELTYHPERFLNASSLPEEALRAMAEKRRWVETEQTRENARQRCRAIRAANEFLQPWLTDLRGAREAQLASAQERRRALHVLRSREYGFPLYPAEVLREFLLSAAGKGSM